MSVNLYNRLSQALTVTVKDPDSGAYGNVTIGANASYGPISSDRLSPYTEQLATRGHLLIKEAQ